MFNNFAVLFCLILVSTKVQAAQGFPKIIWLFQFNQKTNFPSQRLCKGNIYHYAKRNKWLVKQIATTSFSYPNVNQQQRQRLKKLKQMAKTQGLSTLTIHALFLLYENGGMFISKFSMFVGDLDWIDNLKDQPKIYNKIGEEPDILTHTLNTSYGSNNTKDGILLYPGLENKFMLAKKNCQFINDWINKIEEYLVLGKKEVYSAQIKKYNFTFKNLDDPKSGLMIEALIPKILLLEKQKELQQKNSTIKSAVQFYNMWSLDGLDSAVNVYKKDAGWDGVKATKTLRERSLQYLQKKYNHQPYFINLDKIGMKTIDKEIEKLMKNSSELRFQPIYRESVLNKYLFRFLRNNPIKIQQQIIERKVIPLVQQEYDVTFQIMCLMVWVGFMLTFISYNIFTNCNLLRLLKDRQAKTKL